MVLLKLAFRNIFRQRRRSLLTALSMGGGFYLCAIAISMTDGSYNNIIRAFTLSQTGHIQIHEGNYLLRPKIHTTIDNPVELSKILDNDSSVKSHAQRVYAPALAYSDTDNNPASVRGLDLEQEAMTTRIKQKVTSGEYINANMDDEGYFQAMIGAGLVDALNIGLGGEIILISQGADGSVANDVYKVGAIIGEKDSPERYNVYLPLLAAQELLSMPGRVHEIAIVLNDDKAARSVARSLQSRMQTQLPDQFSGLTVSPWQVVESTFYKTMQSDREGNKFSLGIIIFIVFIGVLNTVLMSVLERTREFGVLIAIGSRPFTITRLITLEMGVLALLSIAAALVFALPSVIWFTEVGFEMAQPMDVGGFMFSHMRGEFSAAVFTTPAMIILGSALLVSIPPGLRAARIAPTKAMGAH